MSRQYIFIAVFAILGYSCSCFSSLEQSPLSNFYHRKVHPRNAATQPRFYSQKSGKQNHINYSKFGRDLNTARRMETTDTPAEYIDEINVDHFGARGDGSDDTMAFIRAWKKACSSTSEQPRFHVPARKEYSLKPMTFAGPCRSAITVNIHGTISGSKNLADYKPNITRYWLIFENLTDLTVQGGGLINGNGQVWWPRHCKIDKTRPCEAGAKALTFKGCMNLKVRHLNFINAQQMHLIFDSCNNVEASNIMINAPEYSPNTDGIHVLGSRNVLIYHCGIHTGDDCISIITGSHQIEAIDIDCGPGHGISIGSLGKNGETDAVSNINVNRAIIRGADNGARIKSWQGGKGLAENIIFENIIMQDVKNPIIIDQFYCDKKGACPEQKEAVQIRNVVFKNIRGMSASKMAITLNCSSSVPCEGIKLQNVKLGYKGGSSLASCSNAEVSQMGIILPYCPF